jgi:hypothetical protein
MVEQPRDRPEMGAHGRRREPVHLFQERAIVRELGVAWAWWSRRRGGEQCPVLEIALQSMHSTSQVTIILGVWGPTSAYILACEVADLCPTLLPKHLIEIGERPHVRSSRARLVALLA